MAGLATRCPACGTVFRVVPDQLRVSDGWVRCGRCAEVFDAAGSLLDLDTGAAAALTLRADVGDAAAAHPAAAPPRPAPPLPLSAAPSTGTSPSPSLAPSPPPSSAQPPAQSPAPEAAQPPRPTPAPAPMPPADFSALEDDGTESRQAAMTVPLEDTPAPLPAAVAAPAGDATPPSFLRRAERSARWRRPRVRAALAAALALASAALAAQAALEYRDLIAARHAGLRPGLDAACRLLGCSVGPAHAIDALAVESSGLVRVEKSSVYKLSVSLRNREAIALAMPALELTMTDSQGRLLARRVLRPAEMAAPQATLEGGRDLLLQATLQSATEPVAGYTIELFYP